MTSTPRLDSLAAGGTHEVFDGIRLVDGHVLTLKTRPGADMAQEVFLYRGLTAPNTEAWENEDDLEVWLTGGNFDDGSLYSDVPIQAVRDLIVQHGGEHENQEPPTDAERRSEAQARLLERMADLGGRIKDGYSASDIRAVFERICYDGGPYLVCVWEYADENGFGGSSQFYAEDEEGDLFEIRPDIYRWLSGQQETPGPVDTWICEPAAEPTEFPVSDDFHNYARVDRTA
ncbi:hypothetical protein ACFV2Q_27420 [Streptomyces sp. NPDC059650]|uniref:hypothetical protein n=1 Tax=Streptomyces sp. NPDC059650 TaxID=3346896 RepID=UPI0036CEF9D2